MTKDQKINWLQNAGAQEFLRHYNSTLVRYNRLEIGDADFNEVMEDWQITEDEMKHRLGV